MKLLLVEDDRAIAAGLEYSLRAEGYNVTLCSGAAGARRALGEGAFDLAILDLMLPDGNGYDLCREIKSLPGKETPVIFLTASDEEVNVVMGLDMGADDYITKPFRIRELLSRIKTVLRRYQKAGAEQTLYEKEGLRVNLQTAKVFKDGKEILLTALEYRLLLTLINNEGLVLSRNQLLEGIWDVAGDFVNDNTLSVYIKRLRDKIETDPQNPRLIKTVRGLGYQL